MCYTLKDFQPPRIKKRVKIRCGFSKLPIDLIIKLATTMKNKWSLSDNGVAKLV
jgi:hypothetical protein